jgi:hypothetical protein
MNTKLLEDKLFKEWEVKNEEGLARTIDGENRATKYMIRKIIRETESMVVDLLINAQMNLSLEDFKKIFANAEATPEHYWRHFSGTYDNNLLMFLRYLGKEKGLLIKYLVEKEMI